jgi:hypothetical protein
MKLNKNLIFLAALLFGCSNNSTIGGTFPSTLSGLTNGPVLTVISGPNVLPLTVNGSLCSAANSAGYDNKPCVNITICSTTNSNCQTITDVLVDTGSYGLRIFKSVLNSNIALTPVTAGGKTVADCQQYGIGDGTADWGPVELANVGLGGEPSIQMPIEVIDSSLSGSSVCEKDSNGDTFTLDTSPVQAGFNAIMGVGLFAEDCGALCATNSDNGQYFACSGSSCTGIEMPTNQVSNPVSFLPADNNGVIVELPSIPFGGVASSNGYLVLGIGTHANNTPHSVSEYNTTATDEFGEFTTTFNGNSDVGFIDSGSNSLLFDKPSSLADCPNGNWSGFYCPASLTQLQAVDTANSGGAQTAVQFYVGDAQSFSASNMVFMEIGTDDDDQGVFDWGLPFFLGRNVFVGLDGTPSSLGTGPYWAF